ncbi:energy transducer TonB [soil metagenome]
MAELFSPSWDDATNPDRTEIVFENRNKAYGAYLLRKGYNKTAANALLISVAVFTLAICTPVIIRLLSKSEKETIDRTTEVTVELKEPPPLDKNEPPPPPPPPPPPTIETVKFTPPVVVDREVEEEQPPPQEKLSDTNVGVVTQEGEEGATELPTEPVVDPDEGKIFTYVEEMPTFPGGEAEFYGYLKKNIKYPPMARENGIQGKVYISFVVDKDGNIKDVKMARGIGGGCDEEALRVIRNMPSWKPGKQNGRSVAVSYTVPVNFTLQ